MKQISDKVFAQVQEALRPFAEDAKYIHKDWSDERMRASLTQNTPLTVRHFRKASEALAALDSAQPVQVNAMLLTAAMDLRHALSNVLQRIPSDEWPKWLAVRDEADKMITAAKQVQPVCGYDDETGNCTRVNCCKQAQPEPFTPDWSQDSAAAESIREHQAICNLLLKEMRHIADISTGQVKRVAEQALEAVKQAQPERAPLSADAYEALVEDLGEWSRHVVEDTAHITLDTHIRRTLAVHGIKQGDQQ